MPTYLMLTNLTAEGVRTLKNNPGRVAEVTFDAPRWWKACPCMAYVALTHRGRVIYVIG